MNDQEMKRLLQSAIDHRLSGLEENPFLARRIITAVKGERPMKKKLSVSLILVLALTLTMLGLAYALVQSRVAVSSGVSIRSVTSWGAAVSP